jgi:hypothetical protein
MPTIHLHYLVGSIAIDIFVILAISIIFVVILAISIIVVTEMRQLRPPH